MNIAAGAPPPPADAGAPPPPPIDGSAPVLPFTAASVVDSFWPVSSEKTAEAGDRVETFTTPSGKKARILVKVPQGSGTYSMRPLQPGEEPWSYFQAAVSAATSSKAHTLLIPKGSYTFTPPANAQPVHWQIANVSDLTIDGQGSTLDFTVPEYGIQIVGSSRVVLQNFTIDYPHLLIAALGTVQSANSLELDDGYGVDGQAIEALNTWDTSINDWSHTLTEQYYNSSSNPSPKYSGNRTYTSSSFSSWKTGDRVLARFYVYSGFGIVINDSRDVSLINDTILASPGMGIGIFENHGSNDATGFLVSGCSIKRGAGRLVSAAADGIHVNGMGGDLIVENTEVADQGDDGLNINGVMQNLSSVSSSTQLAFENAIVGDEAAFFAAGSLESLGAAKVTSVSGENVALASGVSGVAKGSYVLDVTGNSAGRYLVRNNDLHNNRGRCMILETAFGQVDHNTCDGNTWGGIEVSFGGSEGPGGHEVSLVDNTIRNIGDNASGLGTLRVYDLTTQDKSAHTEQAILVAGNTITNVPGPGIMIGSTANALVANNTISTSNTNSASWFAKWGSGAIDTKNPLLVFQSANVEVCGTVLTDAGTGKIAVDTATTSGITVETTCPASP